MDNPNFDTYTKRETLLDGVSFFGATALLSTARGVSLAAPSAIGTLALTGINVVALSAFNKIESQFLKVCAILTTLALATLAAPYLVSSLATHSFITLSLDTAIEIGALHLATKVVTYGLFKSGLFFNDYFFLNFPQDVQSIGTLSTEELSNVKQHLINFPRKLGGLPLTLQFILNEKLEEKKLGPLPYQAFSDLGVWSKEDLNRLHEQDLSHLPIYKRAQINELFFKETLPPQKRAYTADELPDIDYGNFKKNTQRPTALWYHLIAQHKPTTPIYPQISNQFYSYKLPPARDESIKLPIPTTLNSIKDLQEYQIPWYYNLFNKESAIWNGLSPSIQEAFNKRFVKPLSLTAVPGSPQQNPPINWKQVALAAAIGTAFFGTVAYYLYTTSTPNPVIDISRTQLDPIPSNSSSSLVNYLTLSLIALAAYPFIKKKPESNKEEQEKQLLPPKKMEANRENRNSVVGVKYRDTRFIIDLEAIPKNILELLGITDISRLGGKVFHITDERLIKELERSLPKKQLQLFPRLELPREIPILIEDMEPDWDGLAEYVNKFCQEVRFEDAKNWAQMGIETIQDLQEGRDVDPIDLEKKLVHVCWGFILHAITKKQEFHEGTIHYHDPGLRLFNFFAPLYYGRSATHYQKRAIVPFSEGRLSGYAHFGYDPDLPLPGGMRTVLIGAIDGADDNSIYIKMEPSGTNLHLFSDPRALRKAHQIIFHAFGFLKSQLKRTLPSVCGDIGEGARKEHMLEEDKLEIKALLHKCEIRIDEGAFNRLGFAYILPVFQEALNRSDINEDIKDRILKYLETLQNRYDYLSHRKGNEVQMGASITRYKRTKNSASKLAINDNDEPPEWKVAFDKLLEGNLLNYHTLTTYLSYLKETANCGFLDAFLSNSSENAPLQLDQINGSPLIFIPIALESKFKWISLLNNYIGTDYYCLLVLDSKNKILEYYNPYGQPLKNDTSRVRGTGKTVETVIKTLANGLELKENTTPRLNDGINSGPLILEFAKQRTQKNFEQICTQKDVNIHQIRTELAKDLRRHHEPRPINQAENPEEVRARLKKELGTVIGKTASELLEKNAQVYLDKQTHTLNKEKIFTQVGKDLQRGHQGMSRFKINGSIHKEADVDGIFEALKTYTKQEESEALKILSTLQQGVFAPIQTQICIDLDLIGMESNFQIRGNGSSLEEWLKENDLPLREFRLDTEKGTIECEAYYDLYLSDPNNNANPTPSYAILKTAVHIDLKADQAFESWIVQKVSDR